MSRTVHHVVYTRRDSTRERNREYEELIASGGNCWMSYHRLFTTMEWHSLYDLRYPAAELAAADRDGRRPRPTKRRHRLEAYEYPRTYGVGHTVSYRANRQERALRAADRAMDRLARSVLRGAQDAVEAAWDLDFPDPRHRHFGVWDSW